MKQFFAPHSIVIFGASVNPRKGGNNAVRNIKQYCKANAEVDYYIVHPKHTQIEGVECYSSLEKIMETRKESIELALIILPLGVVKESIINCIKHKVSGIIIESGAMVDPSLNLSENDLKREHNEISKLLKNSSTRIMGPNALGVYYPKKSLITSIGYTDKFLGQNERNVSLCGQSGLFITGFIYEMYKYQTFGLSKSCAIGNKFDVNECDILEYYLQDSDTDVIALYLEDIRDGTRFKKVLVKNPKQKPIVILKSGRTEGAKKAIKSHTGSMAGNYDVFEGLAKQRNLITVDNFNMLFSTAQVLASCNPQLFKRNRVGLISISGAGCVLGSDYAEKNNLLLPEITPEMREKIREVFPSWAPLHNPIDTWASIEKYGGITSFNKIIEVYLESGEYDALILASIGSSFAKFDFHHLHKLRNKYSHIPIIVHLFGGYSKDFFMRNCCRYNIPIIDNFEDCFKILSKIRNYASKLLND